jgi:hypothetical protein
MMALRQLRLRQNQRLLNLRKLRGCLDDGALCDLVRNFVVA